LFTKILVFLFFHVSLFAADLPRESVRLQIFDKFVEELERVDAEGLIVRKNRPEKWKSTVKKFRQQA